MILRLKLLAPAPLSLPGVSCPSEPHAVDFTIQVARLSFGRSPEFTIIAVAGGGRSPVLLGQMRPSEAEAERDWSCGFDLRLATGDIRAAIAEALLSRRLAEDLGTPTVPPPVL